jgi:hypothetical protein
MAQMKMLMPEAWAAGRGQTMGSSMHFRA